MNKKDYIIAGAVGLITAFFANVILVNTDVEIAFRGFTLPFWTFYILFPVFESLGYLIASSLFSHILVLKQAGRFGIVGLMNFSVDTGLLSILSRLSGIYGGIYIIPLNAITVAIALTNSYFWNHYWTFKEKSRPSKKEFTSFIIVSSIGIAINSAIVFLLTTYISHEGAITEERLEVLAKVGATFLSLFWTFFGYKFIVFKSASVSTS